MISLGEGIKDEVVTSDKVSFSVHSVLTLEMTEASLLGDPRMLDDAYGKPCAYSRWQGVSAGWCKACLLCIHAGGLQGRRLAE